MTKVYLATSGEYSDYRVQHVFRRREDAEADPLADDVEEYELLDGPVDVRTWHQIYWNMSIPDRDADGVRAANPREYAEQREFDGHPKRIQHGTDRHPARDLLVVEGWDLNGVRKTYSEQRAKILAAREGL